MFVCFIYGLEEKNSKIEVIFAVCSLPLTSCLTSPLFDQGLSVVFWDSGGVNIFDLLRD